MTNDLTIGKEAPDFCLNDSFGKKTCLNEFKGKWTVLYFYPRDDTPGCIIEATDFTRDLKEFEKMDADVFGISPDSEERHRHFIEKFKLKVRLLSDEKYSVLEQYGVWVNKKNFGKESMNFGKESMGVNRSTFLINPGGKLAFEWRNVNPLGHAEEVRKTLEKLKQKT